MKKYHEYQPVIAPESTDKQIFVFANNIVHRKHPLKSSKSINKKSAVAFIAQCMLIKTIIIDIKFMKWRLQRYAANLEPSMIEPLTHKSYKCNIFALNRKLKESKENLKAAQRGLSFIAGEFKINKNTGAKLLLA